MVDALPPGVFAETHYYIHAEGVFGGWIHEMGGAGVDNRWTTSDHHARRFDTLPAAKKILRRMKRRKDIGDCKFTIVVVETTPTTFIAWPIQPLDALARI